MREKLITTLEQKYKSYTDLFRPGFTNSLRRLFLHPIKTLVRKIQVKIFKNKFFLVQTSTFFDYPMTIYSFEYCLWFAGCLSHPEIGLQKYIIRNLNAQDIFFDVGAHHGFYSLLARHIIETESGSGEVHAFEPTDTHYLILRKNTEAFDNIHINKYAMCANSGTREFYENVKGKSTIEKNLFKDVPSSSPNDFINIKINCTTLDTYCIEHDLIPTFIKIDVEGSEYEVLRGGSTVLKQHNPTIAMEAWSKPYDNTNHIKAIHFLEELGYKSFEISDSGNAVAISYQDLLQLLEGVGNSNNFIFQK